MFVYLRAAPSFLADAKGDVCLPTGGHCSVLDGSVLRLVVLGDASHEPDRSSRVARQSIAEPVGTLFVGDSRQQMDVQFCSGAGEGCAPDEDSVDGASSE